MLKPTTYILEICDTTGAHQPVARFLSASPFPYVNIGDRFDDEGWPRLRKDDAPGTPEVPRRYLVHSIKHVIIETESGIVARYCLNVTPHEEDRSPVWGKSAPEQA